MKKILIIEDDPVLNKAYTEKLDAEYTLVRTNDGESGMTLAIGEHPNLIILDLILPGNDSGINILTKLKRHEETKDIPVLVITNIDNQEALTHDLGAADYLIKANIDMHEVVDKVKQYIGDAV